MAQILIFGDSSVYGCWDKESGWVNRLRKFLDRKRLSKYRKTRQITDMDLVYPLGRSGDATEGVLERFKFETKCRIIETRETIIIFQVGKNDTYYLDFDSPKKSLRTTPDKFSEKIQKLIDEAKKFTSKIVFIGLTPVDESSVSPLPWAKNKYLKNENVKRYNEVIKSVCKKNDVYFIEIFEKLKNGNKYLEDGLHLNSEGHKRIFELVRDFLLENQIVSFIPTPKP